jgi:hypothetical protein
MIGGGAGIGGIGYRNRRKVLPLLHEKTERAVKRLDDLESDYDILLTRTHAAIRARSTPDLDSPAKEPVDPFEFESRWLVDYLDIQNLMDTNAITYASLESLLQALADAFPLSRFLSLERKLQKNPKDGNARRSRKKMAGRYGLSADAFTVYAEFYRVAQEIVAAGNRPERQ